MLFDDVDTARAKHRRELVSRQLREVMRLTRVIRPCYGEAVLIEHLFVNPADAPGNFAVRCEVRRESRTRTPNPCPP